MSARAMEARLRRAAQLAAACIASCAARDAACIASSAPLAVGGEAQGSSAEEFLFVELSATRPAPFAGEAFVLRLRFGIEQVEAQPLWVQPFQRALDVPIQIRAPWLEAPPGLEPLPEPELAARASWPRCALDGELSAARPLAEQERGGRRFVVWEIERRFVAPRAGTFRLPAAEALCVLGVRAEEDLFGAAQIVERRELRASSAPLELAVAELPSEGRPPGYRGAIGRFEIAATLDRARLGFGEHLRLELRVRGEGNLERLELPRLDGIRGVHRLGVLDAMERGERVARYDFEVRTSGSLLLGPLELPYLDPGPPAAYRIARAEALRVEIIDVPPPAPAAPATEPARRWLPIALGALALGALLALWRLRARRPPSPPGLAEQLVARVTERGEALSEALPQVLAGWLGGTTASLLAPDLAARLERRGARSATAREICAALEAAVASRYGSRRPAEPLDRHRELLERLEREAAGAKAPDDSPSI